MSKLVKSIIGKCVVSILFVTMSLSNFTYNVNNVAYAEDLIEVSEVDKQTLAKENLVMLDIYNSSVFDTSADFLQYVETYGMDLFFGVASALLGQPEGIVFALGDAMTKDIPFRKIDISDLSKKITDKTLEIFGNKVSYVQESSVINANDTFNFTVPSVSLFSTNDYDETLANANNVYDSIKWTFQTTTSGSWYQVCSFSENDIMTFSVYVGSRAWSSGRHPFALCLTLYKNGEWVGDIFTRKFYSSSEMDNPFTFSLTLPFSANVVSNTAKIKEIPKTTNLERNNSTDKMYQIGDNSLRFINSVDNNGQVNGINVLDDNNQLTDEIIKYFLQNSDSTFVDSQDVSEDYQIIFNDKEITNPGNDDVVVPGDDDGNFLTWIASILDNIVNFFKYCYEAMREIFISAKGIVEYVSLVFEILPPPLPSLMKLALIILLLVSVVGFIRG